MPLHESGENYLENIYILKHKLGRVRSVDLASELNFSKPSISRAVHILEDEGYVVFAKDGSLELTPRGEEIARTIYERHEVLTEFFMSLGVEEEQAASDACRMEHVISAESFNKLKEHMSNCPPNCPRASQRSHERILSENKVRFDEQED